MLTLNPRITALLIALCWCLSPVNVLAWKATEGTQIANNIQLFAIQLKEIQQLAKLAQQVKNQLTMINHMATQAKRLSQTDWGATFSNLQKLNGVVHQGKALAYSYQGLDKMMRETYPGYAEYSSAILNRDTFDDRLKGWNQTSIDTMQGALKSMQLQGDLFQDEDATMQALQSMSQSAVGRMQAIQAGNMIAAQQVRQVQMLRQLVMAQMGMQAAFLAGREDKLASQDAAYYRFMTPASRPVLGDGERYAPGQ